MPADPAPTIEYGVDARCRAGGPDKNLGRVRFVDSVVILVEEESAIVGETDSIAARNESFELIVSVGIAGGRRVSGPVGCAHGLNGYLQRVTSSVADVPVDLSALGERCVNPRKGNASVEMYEIGGAVVWFRVVELREEPTV